MSISPFFLELRSAYQSEMDDLRFDSEGRDVLQQRLADKRGEISFLVHMMELSPEMVAVIFHQGFQFRLPGLMDDLLGRDTDEFPEWGRLADGIELSPWARDLAQTVLKAPGGEWFLTVASGLEYMLGRSAAVAVDPLDSDAADENAQDAFDEEDDDSGDSQARKEAGDDWLAEQGFDRKD